MVAGLLDITTGKMCLGEENYLPREHVIAFVPQNYGLLPWQTAQKAVEQNIKISQKKRRLTLKDREKISRLFEQLQLTELKNKYPSQLSGGQRQRVSLMCAFGVDSDLLLLDEPFSALDAFTRENIQTLFYESWEKNPVTTLFVTHDIEEALLLGHKIILMKDKPGEIKTVLENPLGNYPLEKRRELPDFYEIVRQLKGEIAHGKN